MAKQTRTAAENAAHWIAQAERYEREASTVPESRPSHKVYWLNRADQCRAHAATYSSPASGEAQTV